MLIAAGASRAEAYATIFRPQTETSEITLQKAASTLARSTPGVNRCIEALTNTAGIVDPTRTPDTSNKRKKGKRGNNGGQFREKSAILAALEEELPNLRGKDRVDALMKIADLQQMKKEETQTEEERVIFYLPLRCKSCALYLREKEKHPTPRKDGEK